MSNHPPAMAGAAASVPPWTIPSLPSAPLPPPNASASALPVVQRSIGTGPGGLVRPVPLRPPVPAPVVPPTWTLPPLTEALQLSPTTGGRAAPLTAAEPSVDVSPNQSAAPASALQQLAAIADRARTELSTAAAPPPAPPGTNSSNGAGTALPPLAWSPYTPMHFPTLQRAPPMMFATQAGTEPSLFAVGTAGDPLVLELAPTVPVTRVYRCPMPGCARVFRRMEHLKRHVRIHTGEKPFPCRVPGCHKTFSRADNLSQHLRTHMERAAREAALDGGRAATGWSHPSTGRRGAGGPSSRAGAAAAAGAASTTAGGAPAAMRRNASLPSFHRPPVADGHHHDDAGGAADSARSTSPPSPGTDVGPVLVDMLVDDDDDAEEDEDDFDDGDGDGDGGTEDEDERDVGHQPHATGRMHGTADHRRIPPRRPATAEAAPGRSPGPGRPVRPPPGL